jgi:glycosyltransferase involved in cell wall biosynthesis
LDAAAALGGLAADVCGDPNLSDSRMIQTEKSEEAKRAGVDAGVRLLPVSVIVAARNEGHNLPRCLDGLRNFGEVYVIDSHSTDTTCEIAAAHGAKTAQFDYRGGWPKKRQWALDTLPLAYEWVLLLDADEVMTPALEGEISHAISNPNYDGYRIALQMHFLGRQLRHSDASFWKLSLFRRGKAHYECRLKEQDNSMADMEVHEHVVCDGLTARLTNPLVHRNVESLFRYIQKHNEYSNWEARVWVDHGGREGEGEQELQPAFWGTQAQRRRWLRRKFLMVPGLPLLFFVYKYVFRLGFLDGIPGLIYCCFQSVQFLQIKAKIYELQAREAQRG